MVTCKKCKASFGEEYKFCPYCGAKREDTVTCPRCHSEVSADSLYCGKCGNPLSHTEKCPSCGAMNETNAKFCSVCGKPMKAGIMSDVKRIKAVLPMLRKALENGETPDFSCYTAEEIQPAAAPVQPVNDANEQVINELRKTVELQANQNAQLLQALQNINCTLLSAKPEETKAAPQTVYMPPMPYFYPPVQGKEQAQPIVVPVTVSAPTAQQPAPVTTETEVCEEEAKEDVKTESIVEVPEMQKVKPVKEKKVKPVKEKKIKNTHRFAATLMLIFGLIYFVAMINLPTFVPAIGTFVQEKLGVEINLAYYYDGSALVNGRTIGESFVAGCLPMLSQFFPNTTAAVLPTSFEGIGNIINTIGFYLFNGLVTITSIIMLIDVIASIFRLITGKAKKGRSAFALLALIFTFITIVCVFCANLINGSELAFGDIGTKAVNCFTMQQVTGTHALGLGVIVAFAAILIRFIVQFCVKKKNKTL